MSKKDCEARIADILYEYEASCGVFVGFIQLTSVWVKGPDGPELQTRTITLELVQP